MKKLLFSTLVSLMLIGSASAQEAKKKDSITITDTNGKTYTIKGTPLGLDISGTKGKVVFIEFFGHNCPPCLMTIPHFNDLYKKHKGKIEILSFEVDTRDPLSEAQLKAFIKQHKIVYPVFYGPKNTLLISYLAERTQWEKFRFSIPFLIAFNTQGEVKYIQPGMLPPQTLEEIYQELSKPSTK